MLSTHTVEVVPLQLTKHPNADTLSIAQVHGFTCVTGTDQWSGVDKAAFIPPDNLVPVDKPEFSFLQAEAKGGYYHVRAKKIRTVQSFGLLVPAPAGSQVGDDVTATLGVIHYDPDSAAKLNKTKGEIVIGGENCSGPSLYAPTYDLESGRHWAHRAFTPGEAVHVTEKIDGESARYCFHNGQMYCGSKPNWKREYPDYSHVTVDYLTAQGATAEWAAKKVEQLNSYPVKRNSWWEALDATPGLRAFCKANPGVIIYGEKYGSKKLKYGRLNNKDAVMAFDVLRDGVWLDAKEVVDLLDCCRVPRVPTLFIGAYDFDHVCSLAEGQSTIAEHIREGVVVTPEHERTHDRLGRVKLKFVSATYLER